MERLKKLMRGQDRCVRYMFNSIDQNNIESFSFYFELWHDYTAELLHHPLNECGHKLCNEILDFAKTNCNELYLTFYE